MRASHKAASFPVEPLTTWLPVCDQTGSRTHGRHSPSGGNGSGRPVPRSTNATWLRRPPNATRAPSGATAIDRTSLTPVSPSRSIRPEARSRKEEPSMDRCLPEVRRGRPGGHDGPTSVGKRGHVRLRPGHRGHLALRLQGPRVQPDDVSRDIGGHRGARPVPRVRQAGHQVRQHGAPQHRSTGPWVVEDDHAGAVAERETAAVEGLPAPGRSPTAAAR